MTKIDGLPHEAASEETQELYEMLERKMGKVPNVYQVYGHSSAALKANLLLDDALSKGLLTGKEIEIVALVVSEFNQCNYCIAAHTLVGKMNGMSEEQTIAVRTGVYEGKKEQALIDFTQSVLEARGHIKDADLTNFLAKGYTLGHVVEVIGQIAKNFFNNYTNHIANTTIDFPEPKSIEV